MEFEHKENEKLKQEEMIEAMNNNSELPPERIKELIGNYLMESSLAENSRRDFDLVRLSGYDSHTKRFLQIWEQNPEMAVRVDSMQEWEERLAHSLSQQGAQSQLPEQEAVRLAEEIARIFLEKILPSSDGDSKNNDQISLEMISTIIAKDQQEDENVLENQVKQLFQAAFKSPYPVGGFGEPWTKDIWFEAIQWCENPQNKCAGIMQYTGGNPASCLTWCGTPQFCMEEDAGSEQEEDGNEEYLEQSQDWNLWYKRTKLTKWNPPRVGLVMGYG